MSDEKTLFNKNKNKEEAVHAIAKDNELDIVDFSAAFEAEDEFVEEYEDIEEMYEEPRSLTSMLRNVPIFKRKKDNREDYMIDEAEGEDVEDSVAKEDESIKDIKPKKEKKLKGLSFRAKKETESENPVEEIEAEEQSNEDTAYEEPAKEDNNDEDIILIEDFQGETIEEIAVIEDESDAENTEEIAIEDAAEKQKPEKKRRNNFSFLKRRQRELPVKAEETAEDVEIEVLPSFEKSTSVSEEIVVQEETAEEVVELVKEAEEPEVEMLPSFEEAEPVDEEIAEQEETTEEPEIEILPSFEETIEENPEAVDDSVQKNEEVIEEIPTFEANEEGIREIPQLKDEEVIEEIPPFGETTQEKAETNEETEEDKSFVPILTKKDHITFILVIIALILSIVFICIKFIPFGNNGSQNTGAVTEVTEKVDKIQVKREGAPGYYIQSDVENVFYVYTSDDKFEFYECDNKKMTAIQPFGAVNAVVEISGQVLSVKIDYVEVEDKLIGIGVFKGNDEYNRSTVVFKLADLPKGHEQNGKALLLATTNPEAVSQDCNIWSDSFVVDLETGKTTRFIPEYSILTNEGYMSSNGKVPFFTTVGYDGVTNKKDIYLKVNGKESLFASDVTGSFVYTNGEMVCYLKATDSGFDVMKKENDKESVVFSLDNDTSYLYHNEYLFDKYNGNLYNVKTGEEIAVADYGMATPEMMAVSNDGRYLVVLGTVNSALDYQVYICDLKTNTCAKYADDNFSQHENLTFIDDKTIVYSSIDPTQGYEYVMLDISKAF